jgi:hypothetical protein
MVSVVIDPPEITFDSNLGQFLDDFKWNNPLAFDPSPLARRVADAVA